MQRLLRVRPVCFALFCQSQVLPTQVESASWRGPEDHAGRVQVQAVPPQQSAPIEDQRGSYFVHTNQLPTLLFGTDTLLLLQPAKGSLRDSRGWWGAIPDIFRCSIYFFVLSEVIPALLVGWCSSEATTCKYIMQFFVTLFGTNWYHPDKDWLVRQQSFRNHFALFCYIFFQLPAARGNQEVVGGN